jgi:DNA-binding CsgD family transcriptional regulator
MIPAQLKKCNNELIAIDDKPYLIRVEFLPFTEWPASLKWRIATDLEADKRANVALDILEITDKDERIEKYAYCKNGGFDHLPDYDDAGNHNPEYFNCPLREVCNPQAQKHLCGYFKVGSSFLHPKELEVIKLIAEDLPNKQIADIQGVSINTIETHRTSILRKIGADSKQGIVRFAVEKGILK